MSNSKGFFRRLKGKLFGKEREEHAAVASPKEQPSKAAARQIEDGHQTSLKRDPYFVQIGFDFGTSYSKCVCRDVITNKAWIYRPTGSVNSELPFLIPSVLLLRNGRLSHVDKTGSEYHENGLYHLKHAMEKVALEQWSDSALDPYRNVLGHPDADRLAAFVHSCAMYFLAGVFGEVREQIRWRLPTFGMNPGDYVAMNLAVPVADAQRPAVNHLYHRVLYEAWVLSDCLKGHPVVNVAEIERLAKEVSKEEDPSIGEACFIYPEASANVQGFVRSRASSPGIYLFSDTGAGTVDQSIFVFLRRDGREHLTYLHSSVIPLGSSLIERHAAAVTGRTDWEALEKWRDRKESGGTEAPLNEARKRIHEALKESAEQTLARAKKKLIVKNQLDQIRVIFGGGGHCEHPYKTAVLHPFSGCLFNKTISPDVLGMPVPRDLELVSSQAHWMHRLSVAYGLSFERSDLSTFTYPVDVEPAKPEEIWRPQRMIPGAPTKDEC
jgi:hypothetical protein